MSRFVHRRKTKICTKASDGWSNLVKTMELLNRLCDILKTKVSVIQTIHQSCKGLENKVFR